VDALRQLFAAGGHSDIQLVFVSACHSQNAAEAFVQVGVPHVVAVESESQVTDVAARSFTRAFYLALAKGKTVQEAFDIAKQAVSTSPQVGKWAKLEATKFVLLGGQGEAPHHRAIFDDVGCCGPRPIPLLANDLLPVNPEGFTGRSIQMHDTITSCMDRRLVTIAGEEGIGKTALAVAVANYISERRTGCFQRIFKDGVHFVDASGMATVEEVQAVLALKLLEEKKTPINDLLRSMKALLVIVNWRHLLERNGSARASVAELLKMLLSHNQGVKLLVTAAESLSAQGIRLEDVSEKVVRLGPLGVLDAARVFHRRAPRRIVPAELGVASQMELIRTLSRHPLMDILGGHPGRIVSAVAQLDGSTDLSQLTALLLNREGAPSATSPDHSRTGAMSVMS